VTLLEEQLSELLHRSAPMAAPLAYEPVVQLARRRRRRAQLIGGGAVALLGVGISLGLGLSGGNTGSSRDEMTIHPAPATSPPVGEIRQGGITYTLPPGWTRQTTPTCDQQPDHTVAGGDSSSPGVTLLCTLPGRATKPYTSVSLHGIWTRDYANGWQGTAMTWHGQPAWLDQNSSGGVTQVTLTFPLLNAEVSTMSPSAATARALLNRIALDPARPLSVPDTAASIRIVTLANSRGVPRVLPLVVSRPSDITRLLQDLRSLPSAGAEWASCGSSLPARTLILTITDSSGGDRSFIARFDACLSVTAGTGTSATTTPALIADVRRLLPLYPDTPPDPAVTAPVCDPANLRVDYAGSVSPETGEHSAVVNLRNTGSTPCQLFGYPSIIFGQRAGRLVFLEQNGGPYISGSPSAVLLAPGAAAHLVIAKSTCPDGKGPAVTSLQIQLQSGQPIIQVSLPDLGTRGLQYCQGSAGQPQYVADPINIVQIGPIEAGALGS
jgi:hypothetical protein